MQKEEFYINTVDPEQAVVEILRQAIERRNFSDYALDRIRVAINAMLKHQADQFEKKAGV